MEEVEMKEKNKSRGFFYAVIGVATLIVAIIGATFAYFTASQNAGNNVIGGNMATIGFDLIVEKVLDPGSSKGLIPMSNSMVETAINDTTDNVDKVVNATCVDDVGNYVCQIYKITVTNNSTASMFVDGYVALAGGSGVPIDFTASTKNKTTMRWAQVFKLGSDSDPDSSCHYSTAGIQTLGKDPLEGRMTLSSLDAMSDETGFNRSNIITMGMITSDATVISGNSYDAVARNYIRVSEHKLTNEGYIDLTEQFTRANDLTSLLVINQQLGPVGSANNRNRAVFYFVVWLSETGYDQTAGHTLTTPSSTTNPEITNFFNGVVTFISAQGSEVTATFSDYASVDSDSSN